VVCSPTAESLLDKGFRPPGEQKLSAATVSVLGMAILDMRPVWALSGGEILAQLDVLHAEIARWQTRRLELIAAIDQLGYAKEIGAADTVQLLAFRHRLDPPAVRRDLKLATALPRYGLVSAALPDPAAPTSTDGSIQYRDPATNQPTGQSQPADHRQATDPWQPTDLAEAALQEQVPRAYAAVGTGGEDTGGAAAGGAGADGHGTDGAAPAGQGPTVKGSPVGCGRWCCIRRRPTRSCPRWSRSRPGRWCR
jgi:hypothetical protein